MPSNEVITLLGSGTVAAIIAGVFARRKSRAETDNIQVETQERLLKMWETVLDKVQQQEGALSELKKLNDECEARARVLLARTEKLETQVETISIRYQGGN